MNEKTEEEQREPHPADEPDTTLECEYVFDPESARWRARRASKIEE